MVIFGGSGIKRVYENDPTGYDKNSFSSDLDKYIIGGEALLWGNDVQGEEIESRLWPRGMAIAERLWSNPSTGKFQDVWGKLKIELDFWLILF